MQNLLPPTLKCRQPQSGGNIWYSGVIPAFKVRPMERGDIFVGLQLQIFARHTKNHVVYDAQVVLGQFVRTGNYACRPSCEHTLGFLCSGRLSLKDDCFDSFDELDLQFFEDGKVWITPASAPGEHDISPIVVKIVRGYDSVKRNKDEGYAYNGITILFKDSGDSLKKWLRTVNDVQKV